MRATSLLQHCIKSRQLMLLRTSSTTHSNVYASLQACPLPHSVALRVGSRLPNRTWYEQIIAVLPRRMTLFLGGMSLGGSWFKGVTDESSLALLDAYYDAGGNFIDSANAYQSEGSERIIGEWMEKRGIRDEIVLTTKYSMNYKMGQEGIIQANYVGNSSKSMFVSLEASLKKLRTSYIDIFYVHLWDWETSIEELMNALHNLVVQGKVLYLGASDMPAWAVAQANQYARDHGKTPFVIYQGCWNLLERSFEREIIPMARTNGMALAPWSVLASGKFRTAAQEAAAAAEGESRARHHPVNLRPEIRLVSDALEKVGAEVGAASIQAVAIAYVLQKTPYCFPIIGGRKVEQFLSNIDALDISLSKEQIKFLESAVPFEAGFPYWLIGDGSEDCPTIKQGGTFAKQPMREAIRP
ncbi:hypothetical protein MKEN_00423400 [Mycena kentingensis (nom. inval.)]|nr:hypothetical protein MKEN_00423400 [Mycena kentingensis (nom. inval.)]